MEAMAAARFERIRKRAPFCKILPAERTCLWIRRDGDLSNLANVDGRPNSFEAHILKHVGVVRLPPVDELVWDAQSIRRARCEVSDWRSIRFRHIRRTKTYERLRQQRKLLLELPLQTPSVSRIHLPVGILIRTAPQHLPPLRNNRLLHPTDIHAGAVLPSSQRHATHGFRQH
jgi:hypothetical protein